MKQIKYNLSSNLIEDTCVVYGLCKILKSNEIPYTLTRLKSMYLLEYDDEYVEEMIFPEILVEECKDIGKCYYADLVKNDCASLKKFNKYFNENINTIFQKISDKNELNTKNERPIICGSYFPSLSKSLKKNEPKVSSLVRNLAFLGFLNYTKLSKNTDNEVNFLLIPKENVGITNITKPSKLFYYSNKAKELKEMDGFKYHITINQAVMVLKTYYELYKNEEDYEGIMIMQFIVSGNKPLADVSYIIPSLQFSQDLYEQLRKTIEYNYIHKDKRDICFSTSRFIIFQKYNNFSEMIRVWSKNEIIINIDYMEELIKMYNDKVKQIFTNESVKTLARGLKRLINDKKGFEHLGALYSVINSTQIMRVISRIVDDYKRYFKKDLLNTDQIEEIISLIDDSKKDSKIMADAILAYSRIFYVKKNNEVKENGGM